VPVNNETPGKPVPASGISACDPSADKSAAEVFGRADNMMYENKKRLKGGKEPRQIRERLIAFQRRGSDRESHSDKIRKACHLQNGENLGSDISYRKPVFYIGSPFIQHQQSADKRSSFFIRSRSFPAYLSPQPAPP